MRGGGRQAGRQAGGRLFRHVACGQHRQWWLLLLQRRRRLQGCGCCQLNTALHVGHCSQAPVCTAEPGGGPSRVLCALVPRHPLARGQGPLCGRAGRAAARYICGVWPWGFRRRCITIVPAQSAPPTHPPTLSTHPCPQNAEWVLATSDYGGEFVAAVQRGNVCATQVRLAAGTGSACLCLALLRGAAGADAWFAGAALCTSPQVHCGATHGPASTPTSPPPPSSRSSTPRRAAPLGWTSCAASWTPSLRRRGRRSRRQPAVSGGEGAGGGGLGLAECMQSLQTLRTSVPSLAS